MNTQFIKRIFLFLKKETRNGAVIWGQSEIENERFDFYILFAFKLHAH